MKFFEQQQKYNEERKIILAFRIAEETLYNLIKEDARFGLVNLEKLVSFRREYIGFRGYVRTLYFRGDTVSINGELETWLSMEAIQVITKELERLIIVQKELNAKEIEYKNNRILGKE